MKDCVIRRGAYFLMISKTLKQGGFVFIHNRFMPSVQEAPPRVERSSMRSPLFWPAGANRKQEDYSVYEVAMSLTQIGGCPFAVIPARWRKSYSQSVIQHNADSVYDQSVISAHVLEFSMLARGSHYCTCRTLAHLSLFSFVIYRTLRVFCM